MKKIFFILLILISSALAIVTFLFWRQIQDSETIVYYPVPIEPSFIQLDERPIFGLKEYLRQVIDREMNKLKEEKQDFIYIDLQKMQLTLYQDGEALRSFSVAAKGAEWFMGKTPPGVYRVDSKSKLLFSSMGNVWMPYPIRFFGNYFIHGWPFDLAGQPVRREVSGGCVRLQTKDARALFEFAEVGMPILIFDQIDQEYRTSLISLKTGVIVPPPQMSGDHILVADLDTGEILIDKDADSEVSAGPAATIMLALAASESVNLEKTIVAREWMFDGFHEGIIVPGRRYRARDLLTPLITKSSREAGSVLSRFLTPNIFVDLMNQRARSIGLTNTVFADINSVSHYNITTLYDVAKLIRHIKTYRDFILEISPRVSVIFPNNQYESAFVILKMREDDQSPVRSIFVGTMHSADAEMDLQKISVWLQSYFGLELL